MMVLQPAPTTNTALILCPRSSHNENILFYQAAAMHRCICVDTNVVVHEYIHIRLIMIYKAICPAAILHYLYLCSTGIFAHCRCLPEAVLFSRCCEIWLKIPLFSLSGRLRSHTTLSPSISGLLLLSLTWSVDSIPAAALVKAICCCYKLRLSIAIKAEETNANL